LAETVTPEFNCGSLNEWTLFRTAVLSARPVKLVQPRVVVQLDGGEAQASRTEGHDQHSKDHP